jgi:hypothetical protein
MVGEAAIQVTTVTTTTGAGRWSGRIAAASDTSSVGDDAPQVMVD